MGSAASFAALSGVSPVEQSSGQSRHRPLNQGGDRQTNAPCSASCHLHATGRTHPHQFGAVHRRRKREARGSALPETLQGVSMLVVADPFGRPPDRVGRQELLIAAQVRGGRDTAAALASDGRAARAVAASLLGCTCRRG
ncbi:hypothetical protein QMZ92_30715 [Streptomyces sp. HNM0645]|uniref:hypothetical protein n=1 Tax=Streptomyces sp. HNM0645 TaxID=2782343 RepID=UPI0024B80A6A|nr:hypothetical protein [Streptomyces sp. HNM0645]MDI9888619.1 hypothetical protein [Streptomyces sp. HNM0645]